MHSIRSKRPARVAKSEADARLRSYHLSSSISSITSSHEDSSSSSRGDASKLHIPSTPEFLRIFDSQPPTRMQPPTRAQPPTQAQSGIPLLEITRRNTNSSLIQPTCSDVGSANNSSSIKAAAVDRRSNIAPPRTRKPAVGHTISRDHQKHFDKGGEDVRDDMTLRAERRASISNGGMRDCVASTSQTEPHASILSDAVSSKKTSMSKKHDASNPDWSSHRPAVSGTLRQGIDDDSDGDNRCVHLLRVATEVDSVLGIVSSSPFKRVRLQHDIDSDDIDDARYEVWLRHVSQMLTALPLAQLDQGRTCA